MNIFVVNGAPGSGKTSFESLCKIEGSERGKIISIYSTIDFVKEVAKTCGWDGSKTPRNRKFLSDLKALLTEWDDVPLRETLTWLDSLQYRLLQYDVQLSASVVFIDCREPKEIKRLCEAVGGRSLLIRRTDAEQVKVANTSDDNVLDYQYDIVIDNNGDLEDLRLRAIEFIEKDLA